MAGRKIDMFRPTPPPGLKYKLQNLKDLAATAKFIYQIGESEALRQPSRTVPKEKITTNKYKEKFKYLKKCMLEYRKLTGKGRGIAAVQVGIPEKFFVLFMPEKKNKLHLFINPVITKKAEIKYRYPEACMSCNSLIVRPVRPAWIEFSYLTETGEKKTWTLKDTTKQERLYNRVVQHEIDHLEGIVNIDTVLSSELIFESDEKYYKNSVFEKV